MARASLDNKTIIYSEDDNVLASNTLSMIFYIEYRLIYTKELASGTYLQARILSFLEYCSKELETPY